MSKQKQYSLGLILHKFDSGLWGYHYKIPQEIVDALSSDGNRRILFKVDEHEAFHAAFLPDGSGNWFVMLNKERLKEFGVKLGQKSEIRIWKDTSKYGMKMPPAFEELLDQDPEGSKFFEKLTDGKKRTLIYMVAKPKSEETRLRKAIVILHHLKVNNGRLDFKQLNEAFKASRQDLDSFFI